MAEKSAKRQVLQQEDDNKSTSEDDNVEMVLIDSDDDSPDHSDDDDGLIYLGSVDFTKVNVESFVLVQFTSGKKTMQSITLAKCSLKLIVMMNVKFNSCARVQSVVASICG